ncbi:glycosyltransferase family 25 protein [Acinetobacter sp. C32I]|uniref:glycosyltransferase family 25 protein n=1 Tax=Acinetobacter sp. C32I TaxID=2950074 RepID=UPI0020368519|nr:glycosyltransferase family 25 protein [Acinetobacter sp. C32I]USA53214.1 glycosyltransferase family 25 protein [Acinetobacter sp. C32I]
MKNFVISLKSASDRRIHIEEQFGKKGIPFHFFDAIEPSQIDSQAEKIGLSLRQGDLSRNELACLLSHVSLWQKAVDEKIPAIAIFEDDIHLGDDAELFLTQSDWLGVDIVKVEKSYSSVILDLEKKQLFDEKDFSLRRLKKPHLGAAGYILSYKGAIVLLEYMKEQPVLDHVDQIIFRKYVAQGECGIYQLNPALCMQDYLLNPHNQKFKTTLQWRNKQKVKVKGLQKLFRELKRFLTQLKELPYKTKLKFMVTDKH